MSTAAEKNINPNVEVGEESNSESKVGEITSFDQLDRITDEQIRETKTQKRRVQEEKAETKAEADEGSESELGSEVEAEKAQPSTEADAEIVPSMGIDPEKLKPIQLSHGEQTYEILPTANVPMKVDGEKTAVPLQELMSNYAGKQAWDKRFNELNKERQEFKVEQRKSKQELDFVNEKINKFYDLSQSDPIAAFDFLCELTGKDPIEFQKNFREDVSKKYEEYYNMDEIERREFDLSERERYLERKRQAETDKAEQDQQSQAEQAKIQSALESYGIDEGSYFDIVDDLRKAYPDTPIEVNHVIRYERALLAQRVLKDVRPEKSDDAQILGELAAVLVQNPEFKEDDLKGILSEVWKDEPSQTTRDLSKKVLKTQSQAKSNAKAKSSNVEPWSFDQV